MLSSEPMIGVLTLADGSLNFFQCLAAAVTDRPVQVLGKDLCKHSCVNTYSGLLIW
jgi:hypothetical protein